LKTPNHPLGTPLIDTNALYLGFFHTGPNNIVTIKNGKRSSKFLGYLVRISGKLPMGLWQQNIMKSP
jgi:hypothetical protein